MDNPLNQYLLSPYRVSGQQFKLATGVSALHLLPAEVSLIRTVTPSLPVEDAFEDPQWVPEQGALNLCIPCLFVYMHKTEFHL
jgi:hypothetical protein